MNIYKIVLTGGPCAGKTKVFDFVKKELEEDNYYVISVPETARECILNGIVPYNDREHTLKFQDYMLQYQAMKEDIAYDYALNIKDKDFKFLKDKKGIVILYDRSMLDNRAYLPLYDFENLLDKYNYKELDILSKYDLVIDLISTATLKQDAYVNDEARSESPEVSAQLDGYTTHSYLLHHNLKVVKPTENIEEKQKLVLELIYNLINNNQYKKTIISNNHNIDLTMDNSKMMFQTKLYIDNDDIYENIIYINEYKNERMYIYRREFTIDDKTYYKDTKILSPKEFNYLLKVNPILKTEENPIIKVIDKGNKYDIIKNGHSCYVEYEIINKEKDKTKRRIK